MMLPGSNRRIHLIHWTHQLFDATRENPTCGSNLKIAMQSRPAPSSTPVSGPTPSPEEDDHLTIKKLKTQHSQNSGLRTLTPSTPPPIQVQTTISAPPTQTPLVDLEESDNEQGLHSDVLDLLVNSFASSKQPSSSVSIPAATSVAPKIAEQPTNNPCRAS